MSERSKYSLDGVYRCENFEQYVENDNFPYFTIGNALKRNWHIRFVTRTRNGSRVAYPSIYSRDNPKTHVRAFFKILKQKKSSCWNRSSDFEIEKKHLLLDWNERCTGKYMNIEELLDEDNGYLDDGALTVEYGFQVESVEGEDDDVWRFNFWDQFFEWQTRDYMFAFILEDESTVYSHKQIMKLHSNLIDTSKNSVPVPTFSNLYEMDRCLQITHGVRLRMSADYIYRAVIRVASYFGFFNTVKYCERKLIESDEYEKLGAYRFEFAVKHDLRCYLAHLLKRIRTKKQLINFLSKLDLEKMSSESMKAFVAKLFS